MADKIYYMPELVVKEALKVLCEGGTNITLVQWRHILTMIVVGKISVKNAAKLMRIMMLKQHG